MKSERKPPRRERKEPLYTKRQLLKYGRWSPRERRAAAALLDERKLYELREAQETVQTFMNRRVEQYDGWNMDDSQ